jgi:hypothetical protein
VKAKQERLRKGNSKAMKNVISGLLGLSLMIGSAGFIFAAQDKPAAPSTTTTTETPKKVKKHKKAAKPAAPASSSTTTTPPAAK